ncbi:MAG: hypothetical protein FD177_487 [Desulfovibrionaceae bacterium]|nr:MAG: hypothetical protein FD177_487 [Desulfovibrionaceae bacterium]
MVVSGVFTSAPGPAANSTGSTSILKLRKLCFHVGHTMLTVYVPCWTACVPGAENVYRRASLVKTYAVQSFPMLMVKGVSELLFVDFGAQPARSKRNAVAIQRLMERMRPPVVSAGMLLPFSKTSSAKPPFGAVGRAWCPGPDEPAARSTVQPGAPATKQRLA